MLIKPFAIMLLVALISACMPTIHPPSARIHSAHLSEDNFITDDGARLPYQSWLPKTTKIKAIIIALHGFNDYSNFFQIPGKHLKKNGIASYAYDQRGFGASINRGSWAGVEAYTQDVSLFTKLIRNKHPNVPIYILGESMGGAIAAVTLSKPEKPLINGLILAAPAIWSRMTMPWYQRTVLWTMAHTFPWLTLTGKGIKVTPSDNIEMLRKFSLDPLVIKATKVETIYGLSNLMDLAFATPTHLETRLLFLYGEKDEIIPPYPTYQFINKLDKNNQTIALYSNSYHMLLRDLQGEILLDDILAWINTESSPLPSGADSYANKIIKNMRQ